MTEKEVRDYFDSEDRKRGLGDYASEKREIENMFQNTGKEFTTLERYALKLEIMQMAIECVHPIRIAEEMYQWITKPE